MTMQVGTFIFIYLFILLVNGMMLIGIVINIVFFKYYFSVRKIIVVLFIGFRIYFFGRLGK